jgi:aldose 1-epimerase
LTESYRVEGGESEGFDTWTLSSLDADLHATFAPRAGMAGCSLVHAGEQLLHLGDGLAEYVRTGATMGIPLLYPWANRLEGFEYSALGRDVSLEPNSPLVHLDQNGLPIHGLLAGSPHWDVRGASADDDAATLIAELDFGAHKELLAAFPFPHVLRMDARLRGSELVIGTTVTPSGDEAVPVSFGYHPYFRIPGAPRERWEIELPVQERLVLDGRMIPTGQTDPVSYPRGLLADRSFDDAFTSLVPGRSFVAAAAGREVAVRFTEGYPIAQVYSPPGAEFVCFEPMTAPTNALADANVALPTAAGGTFTAVFEIAVPGAVERIE